MLEIRIITARDNKQWHLITLWTIPAPRSQALKPLAQYYTQVHVPWPVQYMYRCGWLQRMVRHAFNGAPLRTEWTPFPNSPLGNTTCTCTCIIRYLALTTLWMRSHSGLTPALNNISSFSSSRSSWWAELLLLRLRCRWAGSSIGGATSMFRFLM